MQSRWSIGIAFLIEEPETLSPLCTERPSDLQQETPAHTWGLDIASWSGITASPSLVAVSRFFF